MIFHSKVLIMQMIDGNSEVSNCQAPHADSSENDRRNNNGTRKFQYCGILSEIISAFRQA